MSHAFAFFKILYSSVEKKLETKKNPFTLLYKCISLGSGLPALFRQNRIKELAQKIGHIKNNLPETVEHVLLDFSLVLLVAVKRNSVEKYLFTVLVR